MVLIAENLHIISKTTKEAIAGKNDDYILKIVGNVLKNGVNVFDLNVGPAKGPLQGALEYLTALICGHSDTFCDHLIGDGAADGAGLCGGIGGFSFDTSNFDEMRLGFASVSSDIAEKSFLNSVSADSEKLKAGLKIALKYASNLIALTFSPAKGIAKTSDERLEMAFSIYESALNEGIMPEKIYFDPLILPVSAAQEQANVVLETIRMLKEGLPDTKTVIGLSNISNGSPKEVRPLLNRVFLVLCLGAGLDGAILDGLDSETIRIYRVVKKFASNDGKNADGVNSLSEVDSLYCSLYNSVNSFSDIFDLEFNKDDKEQCNIIKTAKVLLNKEIYSHSFLK